MNFKNLFLSTLAVSVLSNAAAKNTFGQSAVIAEETKSDIVSHQESIKIDYSFDYDQAISHELLNSRIRSSFAPKNSAQENVDLQKLASSMGFDHFNWVSYVELDPYGIVDQSGTQMITPYLDPPMGGYEYDAADNLPFYWDVVHCNQCKLRYNYLHPQNFNQFELTFLDSPADYRLKPGESIQFMTSLVGVTKYNKQGQKAEWQVLHTFRWELLNVRPFDNRVYLIDTDVEVNQISPALIQVMQRDGAISFPKAQLSNLQ